jgi:hypothetical protein
VKILELWESIFRLQPHHHVRAEVDGWECSRFKVDPAGHGNVSLEVTLPADLTVLPLEADEAMLKAAAEELRLPGPLAANAWRVMRRAFIQEHE